MPKDTTKKKQHTQFRCQSLGSFASIWPELLIACDVRGRGILQTDRQKDRHHNRVTYCGCKINYKFMHKLKQNKQKPALNVFTTHWQEMEWVYSAAHCACMGRP